MENEEWTISFKCSDEGVSAALMALYRVFHDDPYANPEKNWAGTLPGVEFILHHLVGAMEAKDFNAFLRKMARHEMPMLDFVNQIAEHCRVLASAFGHLGSFSEEQIDQIMALADKGE